MTPVMCVCRAICHLKNIISLGDRDSFDGMDWVEAAEQHPHLLMYYGLSTLGFDCDGTTDLAVANKSAIRVSKPELGLQLLFDLRKTITESDVMRAQARVLLGNLLSPDQRPALVNPKRAHTCAKLFPIAVHRQPSCAPLDCSIMTIQSCISCWHDCSTTLLLYSVHDIPHDSCRL